MKHITNIYQVSQYSRLGPLFLGRMNHCTAGSPPCSPFLKEAWILGWITGIWSENHHSLAGGAVVHGSDVWPVLMASHAGYRKVSASAWVVEQVFSLVPPRKTCCLVAACGKYLQNPLAARVGEQTAQRRGESPAGFWQAGGCGEGRQQCLLLRGRCSRNPTSSCPLEVSAEALVSVKTHTAGCRCHQLYNAGMSGFVLCHPVLWQFSHCPGPAQLTKLLSSSGTF